MVLLALLVYYVVLPFALFFFVSSARCGSILYSDWRIVTIFFCNSVGKFWTKNTGLFSSCMRAPLQMYGMYEFRVFFKHKRDEEKGFFKWC